MIVDVYLRKSRSDEELEKSLGQGETLARHRKALLRLAKEKNYSILNIHEELVSGEELFFRPAMLELLKDVESGLCDGVLVMDMQRLGRGDMEEQGIILKAFKKSSTKIITPKKIYDLNDEFDEEYSEFEAFMSRKEYKMINRRMQRGRINSVEEGNYIATRPPYGYDVVRIDKNTRTLEPNPEQSKVIKMMFNWYVNENMGCTNIASELNKLGIKSYTGIKWDKSSISNYLKNPVYIGKVLWKKKCIRKSKELGKKRDTYTRPKDEWIINDGKHKAIIDVETFEKAQILLADKYHVPYQLQNGVTNPFAGLIICGVCGNKMVQRPVKNRAPRIMCPKNCGLKSNRFDIVINSIMDELEKYYANYLTDIDNEEDLLQHPDIELLSSQSKIISNEINILEQQRLKTFDLLEQGVYDINTFTERSNTLLQKITENTQLKNNVEIEVERIKNSSNSVKAIAIKFRNVLDAYKQLESAKDKNILLKDILEKIVYYREQDWDIDQFKLTIYPKTRLNKDICPSIQHE